MSINVKIGKSVVKTFDTSEEPSLEESISDFIEIKNDRSEERRVGKEC